jgi:hypothetical protein
MLESQKRGCPETPTKLDVSVLQFSLLVAGGCALRSRKIDIMDRGMENDEK